MKILCNDKDGGSESLVWCWGLEIKRAFSVLLLMFGEGSREAFHTHAFNSLSWVLSGALLEHHKDGEDECHTPSLLPVLTKRSTFHKVEGLHTRTLVLTLRGPWIDRWREYLPDTARNVILTHGRKEVEEAATNHQ